jgi:two-component system chemotaxis response regulator CheY
MSVTETESPYETIRVLVVEDDGHTRRMICRPLRQIGYRTIHEAANGSDAFRETLRIKPQVILCDIHMQPMNGFDFLKKLRAFPQGDYANTPVIFLSSDTQRDTVVEAMGLNVDGYIAKPVSLAALQNRLDAVLGDLIG